MFSRRSPPPGGRPAAAFTTRHIRASERGARAQHEQRGHAQSVGAANAAQPSHVMPQPPGWPWLPCCVAGGGAAPAHGGRRTAEAGPMAFQPAGYPQACARPRLRAPQQNGTCTLNGVDIPVCLQRPADGGGAVPLDTPPCSWSSRSADATALLLAPTHARPHPARGISGRGTHVKHATSILASLRELPAAPESAQAPRSS